MQETPKGVVKSDEAVGVEQASKRPTFPPRRLLELWRDSTSGEYILIERRVNWNAYTHTFHSAEWVAAAYCDPTEPHRSIPRLGEIPLETLEREHMFQPSYWDRHPWRCIVPERWLRKWYPLRVTPIISTKTPYYCCLCNRNEWECWNCRPK